MLFLLVREEFPLKKIKANTRPIKTLSSCYHFGTVLKYSQPEPVFVKNPFPSCTGDHSPDKDPGFLRPFKEEKSKPWFEITCKKPHVQIWWQFAASCGLAEMMSGGRGRDWFLLATSSSCAHLLPGRCPSGSVAQHRGFLHRAGLWFMLHGTKTTGVLSV